MKALIRSLVAVSLVSLGLLLADAINGLVSNGNSAGALKVEFFDDTLLLALHIAGLIALVILLGIFLSQKNRVGLALLGLGSVSTWVLFGRVLSYFWSPYLAVWGLIALLVSVISLIFERVAVAKKTQIPDSLPSEELS